VKNWYRGNGFLHFFEANDSCSAPSKASNTQGLGWAGRVGGGEGIFT
jgi:hypothetical protein